MTKLWSWVLCKCALRFLASEVFPSSSPALSLCRTLGSGFCARLFFAGAAGFGLSPAPADQQAAQKKTRVKTAEACRLVRHLVFTLVLAFHGNFSMCTLPFMVWTGAKSNVIAGFVAIWTLFCIELLRVDEGCIMLKITRSRSRRFFSFRRTRRPFWVFLVITVPLWARGWIFILPADR